MRVPICIGTCWDMNRCIFRYVSAQFGHGIAAFPFSLCRETKGCNIGVIIMLCVLVAAEKGRAIPFVDPFILAGGKRGRGTHIMHGRNRATA